MTSTPSSAADSSPREPQTIGMVWAQTPGGVIASNGDLPWDVPEDFARFRATVRGHGVIMGRATWDSMPPTLQPMPRSHNVVITRNEQWAAAGTDVAPSMTDAIDLLAAEDEIWVMGGGQIYAQGMAFATLLVVSEIDVPEPAGSQLTPAPDIDPAIWQELTPQDVAGWRTSTTGTRWRILHYRRSTAS